MKKTLLILVIGLIVMIGLGGCGVKQEEIKDENRPGLEVKAPKESAENEVDY